MLCVHEIANIHHEGMQVWNNLFSDCITCSGSTILKTGGSSRKRKLLKRTKSTHHLSPSGILQLSPSGISPVTFRYITSHLQAYYLSPSVILPLTSRYITYHLLVYRLSPSGILPLNIRCSTSHLQVSCLSPHNKIPLDTSRNTFNLHHLSPSDTSHIEICDILF